jgi:pyruvate,orthophosphate dikinase
VADEVTHQTDGESLLAGLGASTGSARGRVCFDPIRSVKRGDEDVVLVRETTSPSDVPGMKAAEAIVTNKGGTTSHAAIVARELGKPAVVGCGELEIDYDKREATVNGTTITEDDELVVDGSNGHVRMLD